MLKGKPEVFPFREEHISAAAELFAQKFTVLRQMTPILPERMSNREYVAKYLQGAIGPNTGIVAIEAGKLAGYLGWFYVERFRGTDRKAAYCPEWCHASRQGAEPDLYRALYRAASTQWSAAGCQVHALTILANDHDALKSWFWNGFGLAVVDAVRAMDPLQVPPITGFEIHQATKEDIENLCILETEHWRHYAEPPVLMAANQASDEQEIRKLMNNSQNSFWLAMQGSTAIGYMRFEGSSFGAADIVNAETTVANTGAYVRPRYRGRGVALALLDAAIRHYASLDYERCSVDFESFNPEAVSFWMKYFEPICYSLIRVPERL